MKGKEVKLWSERASERRGHIVAECTTEREQLLPIQMQIPLNGKDALKNALQDELAQWYTDFNKWECWVQSEIICFYVVANSAFL